MLSEKEMSKAEKTQPAAFTLNYVVWSHMIIQTFFIFLCTGRVFWSFVFYKGNILKPTD